MELRYINVVKLNVGDVVLHCVQSPEDDELVNAQIIETKNKIILIDTLQLRPYANELRQYIDSLKKPLDRVIITHFHPDHWMGSASFQDIPIYALPEVIESINKYYDFFIGYHAKRLAEKAGELMPIKKVVPTMEVKEGIIDFDGLKISFTKIIETEAPVILVVELPVQRVLFAQDLVYHKAHSYFGDKTSDGKICLDNWIKVIREFQRKEYKIVLPGHGDPTDALVLPSIIEYLEFAKQSYNAGLKGQDLINTIIQKYPDYKLPLTLYMTSYMLYDFQG